MIPLHIQNAINMTKINPVIEALDSEKSDVDKLITINNNETCCFIDAHNLSLRLKEIYDVLETTTKSIEILKIGNFLANKLYKMFLFNNVKRELLINKLAHVIYTDNNLPMILRSCFLAFRDNKVVYSTCMKLFDKEFHQNIEMRNIKLCIEIYKFLLNKGDIELFSDRIIKSYSENVKRVFQDIYQNDEVPLYVKMEIADVMLLNNEQELGNIMLNNIRRIENEIHAREHQQQPQIQQPNLLLTTGHVVKTIYQDSQNVHTSDINNSVLNASINLISLVKFENYDIEFIMKEIFSNPVNSKYDREKIKNAIAKIYINTSRFSLNNNTFTLHDVFASLWTYILSHKHKQELIIRLLEELEEMYNYCSTGYLSRLINVIQGFTDEHTELEITVLLSTYIKGKVFNILDKYFKNLNDTDIFEIQFRKNFLNMVKTEINQNIQELYDEHGNVGTYIVSAVSLYTNFDKWYLDKNTHTIYFDYTTKLKVQEEVQEQREEVQEQREEVQEGREEVQEGREEVQEGREEVPVNFFRKLLYYFYR